MSEGNAPVTFTLERKAEAPATAVPRAELFISSAFIGFIALCLAILLVQTLYPVFGKIVQPLEERRAPNRFPSLRLLLGTNGDFAAGLNKWFEDVAGFRDLFIRTKNQIDYTLFHTSRKVYIGSDGWLFPRENGPDAMTHLDAAALSSLEESYLTLARRLHDKGVKLIVVGYPDKSTIYSEMAPRQMPTRTAGGNYDRFRHFLASRSDLTFIDAEEILKREKSNTSEHLYLQQDAHVTEIGQLPVVKEIIRSIALAAGRPDIRWDEKFKLAHGIVPAGSEGRFMSLLFPTPEEEPYFEGRYSVGGQESDGQWFLPSPHLLESADDGAGRPFDWEFRSLPELCQERLPGMVLFGNSFSDKYWTLGLHRYFCFIRRARNPIGRFKAFYDTMPVDTKYFIFEYFEPWLTEVLTDPWFSYKRPR
jgi:hypothetical protein